MSSVTNVSHLSLFLYFSIEQTYFTSLPPSLETLKFNVNLVTYTCLQSSPFFLILLQQNHSFTA